MPTEVYSKDELDKILGDLDERIGQLEEGIPPDPTDPDPGPTPPDPTPEPGQLVYGYSHTNRDRLEKDTGVLVCADRMFHDDVPTHVSKTKMATLPARYKPFFSFKTGAGFSWANPNTSAFRTFLRSIDRPTVVIPSHEPENDGGNPAAFVSQLRKYADITAEVDNPHVELAINLMTSWADKSAAQGGSVAYIPDPDTLACDVGLTWDGYRPKGKAGQSPAQIYATPRAIIADAGYAWWGIMETASETNAGQWARDVTEWCEAEGARACLYWPSQVSDPSKPNYYPPASQWPAMAEVALAYGGTRR